MIYSLLTKEEKQVNQEKLWLSNLLPKLKTNKNHFCKFYFPKNEINYFLKIHSSHDTIIVKGLYDQQTNVVSKLIPRKTRETKQPA